MFGIFSNVTAYRMRGVDGIIVRKKGGVTKARIKNDREFIRTRELNAEFSGRSTASKRIMRALVPLKALADYNIAGPLNAMLRPIQVDDPINSRGKRSILLSKNTNVLEGFSLNRKIIFDSIVRAPLTYTVSRETMSAEVMIPALNPNINFKAQTKHPFYGFEAVLGIVPDLFFSPQGYQPSHKKYPTTLGSSMASSEWYSCLSGSDVIKLEMKLDYMLPDDNFVLMLSIGIRFGHLLNGTQVQQMKYAGAAKVLRVA